MTADQFKEFMLALHGDADAMNRLMTLDSKFEFKCRLSNEAVRRWRGGMARMIIDINLASAARPEYVEGYVGLEVPFKNFFEVWRLGAFAGCSVAIARADGSVGFNCIWECGNGGFQSAECEGNSQREREMCFALAEKRCKRHVGRL